MYFVGGIVVLLVLLAILGEVKSISKQVFHRVGQGTQVPFRASHPVQRLQGRMFVHLCYYTYIGITSPSYFRRTMPVGSPAAAA